MTFYIVIIILHFSLKLNGTVDFSRYAFSCYTFSLFHRNFMKKWTFGLNLYSAKLTKG